MFKAFTFSTILSATLVLLLLLAACSPPKIQTQADAVSSIDRLMPEPVVMSDGYELFMKAWPAKDEPVAIVLALHGFNDYSNAFATTAHIFSEQWITTYAIDQRGFGFTEPHGVWAGHASMQ